MAKRAGATVSEAFVQGLSEGRNWSAIYKLVREGVSQGAFGANTVERFLEYASPESDTRRIVREAIVGNRSWKRRVADRSPLSPAEMERMTNVAEVVREARRIYGGDVDAAERFLASPHKRLGGEPPIIVAAAEGGGQAVREVLARLEEGAPA
ncbi:MAG TPA: antitoxin Xre/MbcA/ParS toxin-binding domain-containing protein [Gemmatimonadaceae bacterium]|nr:antitoxin Xre/MbcA/ParS toxin-binding domain-containing protein [Gemmatimonadaceae bacterium]